MKPMSINAHFDGERILRDEPVELEPNTKLIVTIVPTEDPDREFWSLLSLSALARAYDEEEVDYSLDSLKEKNSEYEGW